MKINLKRGTTDTNIFEQKYPRHTSTNPNLLSNRNHLINIVVSPKNYQKKETNYHKIHNKNYESTLSFIDSKNSKTKTDPSPIFKRFKSVLNDFFEVPLETKISNSRFKIGCICPEVFEVPKPTNLKSKLSLTKFELLKNTISLSPTKNFQDKKTKKSFIKNLNLTQKDDDENLKIKNKSERSSKFASTNVTIRTESNAFSPKTSSSSNFFSPSTTSNKFFSHSDRKLFVLENKAERLNFAKKKEGSAITNTRINMSKLFLILDNMPVGIASKLEKKFPEFVNKNKGNNANSNTNYNDYENRIKIRNMKEKVEKLINK